MATYTMNGIVKVVMEEQTFSSGFKKREFVLTSKDDKYPQDIKFETVQEKTSILNGVSVGDDITVSFDFRGNEYNERFYVNLRAWKLQKGEVIADSSGDRAPHPADMVEQVVSVDDVDAMFE